MTADIINLEIFSCLWKKQKTRVSEQYPSNRHIFNVVVKILSSIKVCVSKQEVLSLIRMKVWWYICFNAIPLHENISLRPKCRCFYVEH